MKYFTLKEMTKSNTAARKGIDNTPNDEIIRNITLLVENILDPLREAWGQPIIVSSGYRCPKLNKAVGGAKSSQHCLGQAADIHAISGSPADNKRLFDLIIKLKLPFDQLINEYPDNNNNPE